MSAQQPSLVEEEQEPASAVSAELLYRDHFEMVYRQILRSGVLSADAEDLVQQVFVVAFRHLEHGSAPENPPAWLRGIALKVVSEHYRWRKVRRAKAWLLTGLGGAAPAESRTPEQEATRLELQRELAETFAGMSAKLRDALVLTEVERLSVREAADVVGVSENTMRSRRRLAIDSFRELWAARTRRSVHV